MILDITVEGTGSAVRSLLINGKPAEQLPVDSEGPQEIRISLGHP
jgi:hypothetical protein